jgi:hypothetical protein
MADKEHTTAEDIVDKVAEGVVNVVGRNPASKRVRKSHILSALVGAVGFALFVDGVVKFTETSPAWLSLAAGFVLMAITGLLLHNLNR